MHAAALLALLPLLATSIDARPRPDPAGAPGWDHKSVERPLYAVPDLGERSLTPSASSSAAANATSGSSWWSKLIGGGKTTPSASPSASAKASASASASSSSKASASAASSSKASVKASASSSAKASASSSLKASASPSPKASASASTKASASASGKASSSAKATTSAKASPSASSKSASITPSGKASASVSGTKASASASAPKASSSAVAAGDDSFAQYITDLHNTFRAEYGAGKLTYNSTLATYAQKIADTCVFKHSGGPYGENLAANSGYKDGVGSSFDEWADEAQYYNWSNPGYSESTGHFTQVVWKATSQLGCGIATCGPNTIFEDWQQNSTFLVCEYYTPGNIILQGNPSAYFKTNVGQKLA